MITQAHLFYSRERNRELRLRKRFSSTIFNLGSVASGNPLPNPFIMPANGEIGISFSNAITADNLTIAVGSRTLKTTTLDANKIFRLGFFEKDKKLIPSSTIAGVVTLHYFNDWFKSKSIANGTFT